MVVPRTGQRRTKIEAPKKVGIGRFDGRTNAVAYSRQPYIRKFDVL